MIVESENKSKKRGRPKKKKEAESSFNAPPEDREYRYPTDFQPDYALEDEKDEPL